MCVVANWIDWLSRMPEWNCIIERRAHGIESAAQVKTIEIYSEYYKNMSLCYK